MSSSDFFRKFQPLFEAKEEKGGYDKNGKVKKDGAYDAGGHYDAEADADENDAKADAAKDKAYESKGPVNTKESAAEFFRKYSDMIVEAEEVDEGKADDVKEKLAAKKEEKAEKYDFGKDSDKDEPKAKKVSGSKYGGSKQKDDEEVDESKDKKLPPWLKKGKK